MLMSATIDTGRFSSYFGGAPIITVPGRLFPVSVEYIEQRFEDIDYLPEAPVAAPSSASTSSVVAGTSGSMRCLSPMRGMHDGTHPCSPLLCCLCAAATCATPAVAAVDEGKLRALRRLAMEEGRSVDDYLTRPELASTATAARSTQGTDAVDRTKRMMRPLKRSAIIDSKPYLDVLRRIETVRDVTECGRSPERL